ncbi:XRE family transcriptional regulator [Vibrio harveyi]|uniref:XRE family transcriptional regulator n=1 Tax=Vibrio harveyi TaxID=669 RepID=UPI0025B0E5E9|nr:LexA family transcriptional regulator [Vibrio harveyi]WJT10958.1 S24 family peptidase [Vibrio harveyi]
MLKDMSTLGQRLEDLRTINKETKEFTGKVAGVTGVTIGKWEKDLIIPRDAKLKRLAEHYNVSFEWLRVGVDGAKVTPVPESFAVSIQSYKEGDESVFFDARLLPSCHSERLVYVQVEGHSMGDILPDGSKLIVDLEDRHYKDDKLYVFKTQDFMSIRRLSFTSTGVRLQSLGSQKDEVLTFQQLSKVDVLGRVISSICPR